MKPGDLVRPTRRGLSLRVQDYQVERVRGNEISLAYEDGFVPRELRNKWFPKASFVIMTPIVPYPIGSKVKISDSEYADSVRTVYKINVGSIGTIVRYHEHEKEQVRIQFINNVTNRVTEIWANHAHVTLYVPRKLPEWF